MTTTDGADFSEFDFAEGSPPKKTRFPKLFFVLLAVVVVSISAEAVAYFVVLPAISNCDVIFTGVSKTSEDVYRGESEGFLSQNWLRFSESEACAFFYEKFPNIESVSVQKVFPRQIFVDIQERQAVASAIVSINGQSVPILIDRKGVIFQVGGRVSQENLPILSGLVFESVKPGSRLHEKLQPLTERLAEIANTNPAYLLGISEIKVVPKSYGSFDLVIFPANSQVRVLVDRNFTCETLQYMLVMLDVVDSVEQDVYEIDLRYGAVSYKKY